MASHFLQAFPCVDLQAVCFVWARYRDLLTYLFCGWSWWGGAGIREWRPLPLIRTPILLDRIPPLWPHVNFMTSLKALSPSTVPLGYKASTYEFWDTILSITLYMQEFISGLSILVHWSISLPLWQTLTPFDSYNFLIHFLCKKSEIFNFVHLFWNCFGYLGSPEILYAVGILKGITLNL